MNKLTLHKTLFAAVLSGLMLFTACDKQIDLAPESIITEKDALSYQKGSERLLANAYIGLMKASKGDAYLIGDVTTKLTTGFSKDYENGSIDSRNGTTGAMWSDNYATINLVNVIIDKLPVYATYDKAIQKQFVAEAKFIRAAAYLNLIKLFGEGALEGKMENLGVPLRLTAFDGYDGSQNIPRSTNGQVYSQIIKDLNEAIPDLNAAFTTNVDLHARATKASARALASRVSLYKRDYTATINYSNEVLADANFSLESSVKAVFPIYNLGVKDVPFSKEVLFGFPFSWNKDVSQYKEHNIAYYYGYMKPDTTVFLKTYNADDMRRTEFLVDPTNKNRNLKFSSPGSVDNLMMIRLSEVLLNKAEAEANQNGVTATAVDLLNQVYQRAFPDNKKPLSYTTSDFSSKQALIDRILQERRWELAFEGHDRFDFIRTGRQPNATLPANKYALPIPQREIDITNGLIKQNSGY